MKALFAKAAARLFLACAILPLAAACMTVPGTGRSQLNFVNQAALNQEAAAAYREITAPGKLSTNRRDAELIKKVGARIARASELLLAEYGQADEIAGFNWEFNLIESDDVNAFCLPGGKVAFYTGIMGICHDEEGIATVMGHEVAHVIAQHGAERASQGQMAQIGGFILGTALGGGGMSSTTADLVMQAYGLGAQIGVLLPFSRAHESEADRIGLSLMALAGYDPDKAIQFWDRMSADSGGSNDALNFLSTHPTDSQRIKNITAYIPEAKTRAETNHIAPVKENQLVTTPAKADPAKGARDGSSS
ncbi:MAG: M48 family metallopeptidase [Deltaproteobacteria bacterium]|jgi:predicted Zn-dependent protease|nr:M48 family metallopeptidase [Deltaproteobacteria bacterium]